MKAWILAALLVAGCENPPPQAPLAAMTEADVERGMAALCSRIETRRGRHGHEIRRCLIPPKFVEREDWATLRRGLESLGLTIIRIDGSAWAISDNATLADWPVWAEETDNGD